MSSWSCDGIPKDGKEYSDLGGAHEPHENFSLDCEICGLPQEAMSSGGQTILINNSSNNIKYILGAVAVGILLIAGGGAAYFSGLVGGDPHLNTYEEAVAGGEEALSIIRTHSNSEELAQAQKHLSEAIAKLSKIPQKASIYPDAEEKMSNYDNLSIQIANKLSSSVFQLCAVEPKPDPCIY